MRWKSVCLAVCVLAVAFGHTASGVVPGNDDCQDAKSVGNVTDLPFDTTTATFDGPGHFILNSPNLWYCYTATCSGSATVSLLGSSFDTQVAVYEGCGCDPAPHKLIKANDDFSLDQSQVSFGVYAGNQYLIEVGGTRADEKGPGLLSISCDAGAFAPSNDDCGYAESVSEVIDLPFDTTRATFDGLGHCTTSSPNLWYLYTASRTADVTVSLFALDIDFDTKLAVYPSADALIECNDDFGSTFDSQITFPAVAGEEYLIEVGGLHQDYVGQGLLSITNGTTPVTNNDECKNARPIGDVDALYFETDTATFDGPGHCMSSPNIWYCYTPACTGQATISLCDSGFDTMLAVYKGCQCHPEWDDLIACDDDSCNAQSEVTIDVVAGEQYLIEVGGYSSETGQGVLSVSVSCDAPEKSDLGDAPDSTNNSGDAMTAYSTGGTVKANYPTVFNDGSGVGPYGPAHTNFSTAAYLGKKISREDEADKGPDEDGVNNISPSIDSPDNDHDDDGVVFPLNLPHCEWTTFDYQVTVIDPKVDLWVNVWLDFNRDGDWDDAAACEAGQASEWAVQNQYLFGLPVGLNQIVSQAFLSWHPKSAPEGIWMRITLSEQPWKGGSNPGETGNGGSGPATKYATGETEDYYFIPDTAAKEECPLCEDVNGDGVIDMEDLAALTAEWLEKCI
ncbi:MAG: GEVED domain-containing protein [Planctomycetota bacterium]|jgi:hypothetical protein